MTAWLPWHEAQATPLLARLIERRFPHALLLTGRAGLGKRQFALNLAAALLCQQRQPGGVPCGRCRGCELYAAQTHPDLNEITLLDDKKIIGVDQIRAVSELLALTAQFAGYKIVIISPADKMHPSAANALLKTLEEPPAGSVLMLVTARPAALPATIRSRCQRVSFAPPATASARRWLDDRIEHGRDIDLALRLCQGAPLAALQIASGDWLDRRAVIFDGFEKVLLNQDDPVSIAAGWLKFDPVATIYCLYSWITDMIRLKTGTDPEGVVNRDLGASLQRLADACTSPTLFQRLDQTIDAWRSVESQLNTQLLLENLLIAWADTRRNPIRTAR